MLTFASAFGAIVDEIPGAGDAAHRGFPHRADRRRPAVGRPFIGASAALRRKRRIGVIIAVLVGSGFPALAVLHLDQCAGLRRDRRRTASQATAISAASQQISIAIGVAVGGGILESVHHITGRALDPSALRIAFTIVGTISVLGCVLIHHAAA